jgi:hypothetical protein
VQRVRLLVYPTDDESFRELCERLLESGSDTPARLQAALRRDYPRTRVVEGVSDAVTERWYVYRDGRLIGGGSSGAGYAQKFS